MANNALLDLSGQEFGFWRVIEQAPRRDNKTRWLCECKTCGTRLSLRSTTLRISKYEKCFGTHAERRSAPSPLRKPLGYAAETETIGHYKASARSRGFSFSLSREEFHDLSQRHCHYCGAEPSQRHSRRHFHGAFVYNGIDRKNSSLGYDPGNCVPCCATCNVMKQDLPYDDFLEHIGRIAHRHQPPPSMPAAGPARFRGFGVVGNTRPANIEALRMPNA